MLISPAGSGTYLEYRMRFIGTQFSGCQFSSSRKYPMLKRRTLPAPGTGHRPPATSVERSPAPERFLALVGPLFRFLRLLLSGCENAFLAASNAFMRVQPFQHELGGRDLRFRVVLGRDSEGAQFVHQSLNALHALEHLLRTGAVGDLNLASQVEPLHDLPHIHAAEVVVVGLGDRGSDDFPADVVSALHLAFVLQFQFAGDRRQGRVTSLIRGTTVFSSLRIALRSALEM